jgi:hypothetical protein
MVLSRSHADFHSIYSAHDEAKDRDFELELSWIAAETGMKHEAVPKNLYDEAVAFAQVRRGACSAYFPIGCSS